MNVYPRSLAGQLAALVAMALLVAQAINFAMLMQSRDREREAREDAAMARFLEVADRETLVQRLNQRREGERRPRWMRAVSVTDTAMTDGFEVLAPATQRLRSALKEIGYASHDTTTVARIDVSARTDLRARLGERLGVDLPVPAEGESRPVLLISSSLPDGKWLNVVQPLPPEPPLGLSSLIAQTVITYLILLAAVVLGARRLSRPLTRLTAATRSVLTADDPPPLPPEGPDDIRALTESFEIMRARISALFTEKDVMLGALGHDLRTPLTSLRIRVESVGDDKLRADMITTIEEMAVLLEDILSLARNGRSAAAQTVDIRQLINDVIRDFPDAPVNAVDADDVSGTVVGFPPLLRRALRNLVDNALRYGGGAILLVRLGADDVAFIVEDDGPGVPAEQLDRLKEPFVRGEESRNRQTGGSGLGLALSERVARAHGGTLTLENRPKGGFRATLRVSR